MTLIADGKWNVLVETQNVRIDWNIMDAIRLYFLHGIYPGTFAWCLLEGIDKETLMKTAHPLIHDFIDDHIIFVESLPSECRGENVTSWKGVINNPDMDELVTYIKLSGDKESIAYLWLEQWYTDTCTNT